MPHLTREKLEELTLRWENWEAEAVTLGRRVGRSRLHLLFLLIRYGGLRLGEVLDLDARKAIDTATGMVAVSGPNARDVLLPVTAMKHIRRILSLPEAEEMGKDFLRFDQGFIRKKFYAVAGAMDIDTNQVGPRAVRYARGLELLELHVPLNLVQKILGQQKPSQIAAFLDFAEGEARRIVQANVQGKSAEARPDIRNSFLGIVSNTEVGMRVASVEVSTFSDLRVTAVCSLRDLARLELREGQVVTALVDPERIVLSTEKFVGLTNCVTGTVDSLHREKVESFVCLSLPDGTRLCATLETPALEKLRLAEGKQVHALFSARAVRLCLD